ncbi:MAG: cytochrome c [Bacteroidetes bacterium]|nr:cytochrome c [Bacteroidota bacterium]
MKKYLLIITIGVVVSATSLLINGCKATQEVAAKGGSELWSENCGRCHNAPNGSYYTREQWDVIGTHMRMRAHITADETRKIVDFLQSAK